MYIDYYSLLVCCITIRYCSIIKYYNYYEYIPSSILSFKTIMIYIYNNTLIYSINYIRLDCLFKINAARKSKVDDNTAKMQSIKQLGV